MFPYIVLVYEKSEIGFNFWMPWEISSGSVGLALRVESLALLQWLVGFVSHIEFPIEFPKFPGQFMLHACKEI